MIDMTVDENRDVDMVNTAVPPTTHPISLHCSEWKWRTKTIRAIPSPTGIMSIIISLNRCIVTSPTRGLTSQQIMFPLILKHKKIEERSR